MTGVLKTGPGVVIVNYNCAPLALDAALSVLGDDPSARVVIVDNSSTDASIEYFQRVFSDRRCHLNGWPPSGPPRPVFADVENVETAVISESDTVDDLARLTVLKAARNGGFAAGSNLGMEWLQRHAAPDWFLLLNPDAIVASGSITAFKQRLEQGPAGLCGASVLRFEAPGRAQAFGGASLNPLTLLGRNIGADRPLGAAPSPADVEARMDYPLGAAMALSADYRKSVGDLDERFFLYYEEADWALRGGRRRPPVWAPGAIIYHRHGAAAGSRQEPGLRAPFSDYHMARSRMLFAMKRRPFLVPLLLAVSLAQALRRYGRGRISQAKAVARGAFLQRWKTV
ncbi:MAG: glycosyltransferase family 2 protein [Pseudomonadota bacterium]